MFIGHCSQPPNWCAWCEVYLAAETDKLSKSHPAFHSALNCWKLSSNSSSLEMRLDKVHTSIVARCTKLQHNTVNLCTIMCAQDILRLLPQVAGSTDFSPKNTCCATSGVPGEQTDAYVLPNFRLDYWVYN